jgi:uncharacterized protein with HEPN domain
MLQACNDIISFVDGIDEDEFFSNRMINAAVVREFEILGEAAKQISEEFKSKNAGIPWREMIGMRNKLIHDYMEVDLQLTYDTANKDIPLLLEQLEKLAE